ncbi:hypothetical protein B0H10DRAFT_1951671 [Mycena sp. CBHHK59/15]|nr:hypothetical protein B0H10DRAFT_1951671 [Mycena sp. CBHHK59/15]
MQKGVFQCPVQLMDVHLNAHLNTAALHTEFITSPHPMLFVYTSLPAHIRLDPTAHPNSDMHRHRHIEHLLKQQHGKTWCQAEQVGIMTGLAGVGGYIKHDGSGQLMVG